MGTKAFLIVLTFFASGEPDVFVTPKLLDMADCNAISGNATLVKGFARDSRDGRKATRAQVVCQPLLQHEEGWLLSTLLK